MARKFVKYFNQGLQPPKLILGATLTERKGPSTVPFLLKDDLATNCYKNYKAFRKLLYCYLCPIFILVSAYGQFSYLMSTK